MKGLLFLCIFFALSANAQHKVDVAKQMRLSAIQYKAMLGECEDPTLFPQSSKPDGSFYKRTADWWCSGFFSGNLWYLYEYTKDTAFKTAANKWSLALQNEQYDTTTHDLGFMMYCSFGNGYRLTKNAAYKPMLLNGAKSLSTRFHPQVGVIKSWDQWDKWKETNKFFYPVIIDNMMNLEYLFWATRVSGDSQFYKIAVTHADNTMKNHFRKDYSSYHVVCYDSVGGVMQKLTAQGFADSSAWARGQAWALYGYTVMYRETKDKKYLTLAKNIAQFYMNHPNLPKDKIPYWDFNSPLIPNDVRDASAAAVVASALLELKNYATPAESKTYFAFAEDVLASLSSPAYFTPQGNNHFILKHSTGHKPANSEIDVPIIYADYYYLEALLRYSKAIKTM